MLAWLLMFSTMISKRAGEPFLDILEAQDTPSLSGVLDEHDIYGHAFLALSQNDFLQALYLPAWCFNHLPIFSSYIDRPIFEVHSYFH